MRAKRIFTAVFAGMLCLALGMPAFAANKVTGIDLEVTLRPDGSAFVVQTWNGSFDEGTECYFPVTNLGDITVSDLQVLDGDGPYAITEPWDTGASFEEKARTCGMNPVDGGYEVCWGISKYGDNRYAVEYILGGLAGAYDDADGFLFQFVPDGMNTGPTDVTLRIVTQDGTPLTEENTGIWAFGFEGEIQFEAGGVFVHTRKHLTGDNSIIVMLQLEKGILTPCRVVSGTIEDMKSGAFEGSDYDSFDGNDGEDMENDPNDWLYLLIGSGVIAGAAGFLWLKSSRRKRDKLYREADYWREPPIGGNLEASLVLAERFSLMGSDDNLIAATLIRLLAAGCLIPENEADIADVTGEKKGVSLRLVKHPTHGLTAFQLYDLLTQAAGSDRVLKEWELERYCKTNYTALLNIVQEAKRDGMETLEDIGCYRPHQDVKSLSGLTDRGRKFLLQLMGYKKYLLDFSLIAERGADEALIWQDCLTYAALFGIGKQVLKELRKFYPDVNASVLIAENTYYMACRYNHITYQTAKSAEAAAKRSSGGGGFSSLGGGGFSGGGSGGGTR